mmetsp:Transcript_11513/g.26309  ORF Transcript_11513/g.26309 Transcript_11513/m.26309 type:complete len:220 (-) Transcript_11513:59-718(-)
MAACKTEHPRMDVRSLLRLGCWGIEDKDLERRFQEHFQDGIMGRVQAYAPYFIGIVVFQSCMGFVFRYLQSDGFTASDKFLLFRLLRTFLWIFLLRVKIPFLWKMASRLVPWIVRTLYVIHIVENAAGREWEAIQFSCVCNVLLSPLVFHSFHVPFLMHSLGMFSRHTYILYTKSRLDRSELEMIMSFIGLFLFAFVYEAASCAMHRVIWLRRDAHKER